MRPGGPNRPSTAAAGSAANVAEGAQPEPGEQVDEVGRHRRTSASTEPASTVTGHGARNAGVLPRGTTTASRPRSSVARAASPAANVPSAMPARTSATPSSRHARRRCAPPARRHRRSSATARASGTTTARDVRAPAAGTSSSTARTTSSNARASAVSSASSTTRPAQRASASRARSPTATPSARASADADRTTLPRCPRSVDHDRHVDQRGVAPAGRDDRPVGAPQRAGAPVATDAGSSGPGELAGPGAGRRASALHLHLQPTTGEQPCTALQTVVLQAVPRRPGGVQRVRRARRPPAPRVSATTSTDSRSRARASSRRASPRAHPTRHLGQHQAHAVEQGRDHGGPAGGGHPPDHREPVERDPGLGRGERRRGWRRARPRPPTPPAR